ncbi:hypothetical protein CERSUDRAFT_78576 [Gelatoporia subvermispora B]|uniref:Uncharacterized protein n=1 Tax=Ceriporiopsis subvermispora (strain B) TaxID=914234 RepID=M2QFQ8_CERS8|nr:hypothetical protein CERSUDRAFT_78576 [Gelatoporia subvermispora B]
MFKVDANMAIAVGDTLLREWWPDNIGLPDGDDRILADLEDREKVPDTFECLCLQTYVSRASTVVDKTRLYRVLHYIDSPATGTISPRYEVNIRIQGYIQSMNLTPYGNWTSALSDAKRAIQYLAIVARGSDEVFGKQIDVLDNLRRLIHHTLDGSDQSVRLLPRDKLYLQRRVFQKPVEELIIGVPLSSGRVKRINHLMLSEGDFVDVAVSADIVSIGNQRQKRTRVHFQLHHVLQLMPSSQVELYLAIVARGSDEVFGKQIDVLDNLRRLIHRTLDGSDQSVRLLPRDKLYLQRRVFQKTARNDTLNPRLPDPRHEDALNIASTWQPVEELIIGVPLSSGRVKRINHLMLSEGDFVDVAVSADIVSIGNQRQKRTRVHFQLHHVLQLMPSSQVELIMAAPATDDVMPSSMTLQTGITLEDPIEENAFSDFLNAVN